MWLWRQASPKSARWARRLETQGLPMLQFKSKSHLLTEFPLAWKEVSLFVNLDCQVDWIEPTHIGEGKGFSQCIDLHVNHIQKHPYKGAYRIMFDYISRHNDPVKLT